MGRKITGHVEWRGGRWQVQASDAAGARDWHYLPASIRVDQEALAKAVGARVAEKLRGGEFVPSEREETVADWFYRWTAWRKKRGAGDADKHHKQYAKYLDPEIGHMPIASVRREHLKAFVAKLDALVTNEAIAWKTATNLWSQIVSKPFKDATDGKEAALCVLDANPAAGVQGPDKGVQTRKQYLYPEEALQLLASEAVPLWRRQLYACAIYTYMRAGELTALRWEDVDVERGIIVVHQASDSSERTAKTKGTKTGQERRVIIESSLRPLFASLHAEAAGPLVFPKAPPSHGNDGMAATLRLDLERADVTRAALIKAARTRKRMTFHDLRATGITWAAIRGDDALKIMSRSGHTEYQTLLGYIREAEVMREGFGTVFPALPNGLLGKNPNTPQFPKNNSKTSTKWRPQGDSNRPLFVDETPRNGAESRETGLGQTPNDNGSLGVQPVDAEAAVRTAIKVAVDAGRYELAGKLLDVLKASPPVGVVLEMKQRPR